MGHKGVFILNERNRKREFTQIDLAITSSTLHLQSTHLKVTSHFRVRFREV